MIYLKLLVMSLSYRKKCRKCDVSFSPVRPYYVICNDCHICNNNRYTKNHSRNCKKCRTCSTTFTPRVYYHVDCDDCFGNKTCQYCSIAYKSEYSYSKYCKKYSSKVFTCKHSDSIYEINHTHDNKEMCIECLDKHANNCIVCDEKYYGNTERCKKCTYCDKKECSVCNNTYWTKSGRQYQYSKNMAMEEYEINYCDKCYELVEKITGSEDLIDLEIDNNYNVIITFIKDIPEHDGYCSDPGEISRTESHVCKKYKYYKNYPITNAYENGEIDEFYEGNILLYHKLDR